MELYDERIPTETFATCLDNMPQPCVDLVVEYDGGESTEELLDQFEQIRDN